MYVCVLSYIKLKINILKLVYLQSNTNSHGCPVSLLQDICFYSQETKLKR